MRKRHGGKPALDGPAVEALLSFKRRFYSLDRKLLGGLCWDVTRKACQLVQFLWKYERGKDCPYCRSPESSLVEQVGSQDIRRCAACSLVFSYPRYRERYLSRYYSRDFVVAEHELEDIAKLNLSRLDQHPNFNRQRELAFLLEEKRSGLLLDIGCSWGFLMLQAMEKGFSAKGVEVSSRFARFGRERLGLDIFIGQLTDAHYPGRSFDALMAVHSLEHLPDIRGAFAEMHRILREDGVAVITVPNFDSATRRMRGTAWEWLTPWDHYYHFTADFLGRALRGAGFEVSMRSEEGQYGTALLESACGGDEIRDIFSRLEGSELIVTARKRGRPADKICAPDRDHPAQ